MLDLTEQTYGQLADVIRAVRDEVCRRTDDRLHYESWRLECNAPINTLDVLDREMDPVTFPTK